MQNVLILGGASDLGIALARKYASEKYSISIAGRNLTEMQLIAGDLAIRYGVDAAGYQFDARNFDSHEQFYRNLIQKPAIGICVFGFMGEAERAIDDWSETRQVIETNYTGAVSICNVLAAEFLKLNAGMIIGISSVAGDRGRGSNFVYGSAKAAFTAYLSGLRNRLFKSGIHIMTVKPGFMYTRMTESLPLPALLTASPQEAAEAIYRAAAGRKDIVYVKWFWAYLMLVIRNIPEFIFKKLSL